jgi:anaerobic glycerol-3-phosphate dehydrogenase
VGNPMAPPNVKGQTKWKWLKDMRDIIMGSPMVPPSVGGIRVNIMGIRG